MPHKKLRIAIIGSYGNGKSTLAKALQRELNIPLVHASPMSMAGRGRTIDLNTCNSNELLQLSLSRHTERLIAEATAGLAFISDGSLMHEWFYAVTRLKFGRFPQSPDAAGVEDEREILLAAQHLREVAILYAASAYTHLLLVRNEAVLLDNPAPISEAFRELLDQSYRVELAANGLSFSEITGTPDSRLAQAVQQLSLAT